MIEKVKSWLPLTGLFVWAISAIVAVLIWSGTLNANIVGLLIWKAQAEETLRQVPLNTEAIEVIKLTLKRIDDNVDWIVHTMIEKGN